MSVVVLIEYKAQGDKVERAVSELEHLITTVVNTELDCYGIRMLQDSHDPSRILLYELWSSRSAYEGPHFQTPHLQAFIATAGELFAGPPKIEFWKVAAERLR